MIAWLSRLWEPILRPAAPEWAGPRPWARCVAPLLALALVGALHATTLQTDIGASNDPSPAAAGIVGPLMDDSGEFVVAWHTWGVAHPPGYPLLNALANALTWLWEAAGASAAAAASLVSFTFGLLALAALAWPLLGLEWRGLTAATAILLPACGPLLWLYASVAEVYTFALLLGFGALALALEVGQRPTARKALALGLVFGLAVGHHRTLVLFIPALALAAWPALRLGWRPWLGAAGLAVLSLGVYAYLPLVAALGSPWVYGRSPLTWPGLLDALLAREYLGQIPVGQSSSLGALLLERLAYLAQEMTLPGLALGLGGLALAISAAATRRLGLALGAVFLGYLLFPVSQLLLIGTHLPIMAASLALAAAWGLSLAVTLPAVRWGQLALTLTVLLFAFGRHQAQVLTYTHDPLGRQMIDAVAALEEERPTVVEVWGPRYFALAYGKWASRDLAHIDLVDGRGDLAALAEREALPPTLYTTSAMLYLEGPGDWAQRLGGPVAIESAGDGLVAIRRAPRRRNLFPPRPPADNEAGLTLDFADAWRTQQGDLRLTLEWRALRLPPDDYHVFVHVVGQPPGDGPEQVLAQGDRRHPVYGFYPTSQWTSEERVRDDYRIAIPRGARPTVVRLGLYLVEESGAFRNLAVWEAPIR